MWAYLFLLGACLSTICSASDRSIPTTKTEATEQVPFLPLIQPAFKIQPAIPEDYIAIKKEEWVYWGSKESFSKYFQDRASLDQPLIRYTMFPTKVFMDQDSWKDFQKKIKTSLENQGAILENEKELKWGPYLVWASIFHLKGGQQIQAFVSLEAVEAWILIFQLIPKQQGQPDDEDLKFWNRFLEKTEASAGAPTPSFDPEFDASRTVGQAIKTLTSHLFSLFYPLFSF
jgi:hypothetical protein